MNLLDLLCCRKDEDAGANENKNEVSTVTVDSITVQAEDSPKSLTSTEDRSIDDQYSAASTTVIERQPPLTAIQREEANEPVSTSSVEFESIDFHISLEKPGQLGSRDDTLQEIKVEEKDRYGDISEKIFQRLGSSDETLQEVHIEEKDRYGDISEKIFQRLGSKDDTLSVEVKENK